MYPNIPTHPKSIVGASLLAMGFLIARSSPHREYFRTKPFPTARTYMTPLEATLTRVDVTA
ncbi:hypothetical protein AB7M32_004449 [Pseudomonas sp. R151218B TE3479]